MIEDNIRNIRSRRFERRNRSCHLPLSVRHHHDNHVSVRRSWQWAEDIHCDKFEMLGCAEPLQVSFAFSSLAATRA